MWIAGSLQSSVPSETALHPRSTRNLATSVQVALPSPLAAVIRVRHDVVQHAFFRRVSIASGLQVGEDRDFGGECSRYDPAVVLDQARAFPPLKILHVLRNPFLGPVFKASLSERVGPTAGISGPVGAHRVAIR